MLPNREVDKLVFKLIKQKWFRTTKSGKVFCAKTGQRLDKEQPNHKYFRVYFYFKGIHYGIQAHRLLWMKRNKSIL